MKKYKQQGAEQIQVKVQKVPELIEDNDNNELKIKLDNFDGPLDLLLELTKNAKIDIKDIFISKVTEQFMNFVNNAKNISAERIGDFLEMSATLLEIKSRKLLPVPEIISEDEEDPEQKLIRRLEEYKLIKEENEKLAALEDNGKFYRKPDDKAGTIKYELGDVSYDLLLDAFAGIMHKIEIKAELPEPKKIQKDRFTVAQKMTEIKDLLASEKQIKFTSLYSKDFTKSEVINTFLAILELLKIQEIKVTQKENFAEIEIVKAAKKNEEENR